MDICDSGHEEIAHSGRHCPMCALVEEFKELDKAFDTLREYNDELENDYAELTNLHGSLLRKAQESAPEILI